MEARLVMRSLQAFDLESVYALSRQVSFGEAWSQQKLASELQEAQSLALFVGDGPGAELVAFIFYRDLTEAIEISWLATDPRWVRQGKMSELFAALTNAAGHSKQVWLEVHESNKGARNLYEKMGFVVTSTRPRYYADGGAALLLTLF